MDRIDSSSRRLDSSSEKARRLFPVTQSSHEKSPPRFNEVALGQKPQADDIYWHGRHQRQPTCHLHIFLSPKSINWSLKGASNGALKEPPKSIRLVGRLIR